MAGSPSAYLRTVLVAAYLGGVTPEGALAQPAAPAPIPKMADAGQTERACKAIAAIADRGADALKAADLSRRGHGTLLDLMNDGHPKVIHFDTQGTAHGPVLEDEGGNDAWGEGGWDVLPEPVRWANELSVLKAEGRTWVVSWDDGSDVAVLDGAADGRATCQFRTEWLPPRVKLLSGGRPTEIHIYRDLLFGRGHVPPKIEFHDALGPWSLFHHQSGTTGDYGVGTDGWRVDLSNSGHPLDLVGIGYSSGAGSGCESSQFGSVQNGMVVASILGNPLPPIVPLSSAFDSPSSRLGKGAGSFFDYCNSGTYTPVLDEHGRAYVMLDNTQLGKHLTSDTVRVLVGARGGKLQPLARLVWSVRNHLTEMTGP